MFRFTYSDADLDGKEKTVTSVDRTLAARTAHATSLGSATVKKAGVDFSATKVRF